MNHILSTDEKLLIMGFEKSRDYLSKEAVNVMYIEWIDKHRITIVLEIINKILEKLNYKKIDKYEELKIVVADLKLIDPVEFIGEHKNILSQLYDFKDFDPNMKDKKKYMVSFFKNLMKSVGYKVEYYQSTRIINDAPKTVTKYRLVKFS